MFFRTEKPWSWDKPFLKRWIMLFVDKTQRVASQYFFAFRNPTKSQVSRCTRAGNQIQQHNRDDQGYQAVVNLVSEQSCVARVVSPWRSLMIFRCTCLQFIIFLPSGSCSPCRLKHDIRKLRNFNRTLLSHRWPKKRCWLEYVRRRRMMYRKRRASLVEK